MCVSMSFVPVRFTGRLVLVCACVCVCVVRISVHAHAGVFVFVRALTIGGLSMRMCVNLFGSLCVHVSM